MSDVSITPTLTFPLNLANSGGKPAAGAEAFKRRAIIPANDRAGITIDNVLPGYEIFIYNAPGIAPFKETNMGLVKATHRMANAIATDGVRFLTDGAVALFVKDADGLTSELKGMAPANAAL